MPRRHPAALVTVFTLLVLVLALVACSDDDPVTPPEDENFALTVTVLDAAGQPLVDEPVHLMPRLPDGILPIGKDGVAAVPPAVVIPFTVPRACLVDMEVRDVTGATVRTLIADHEAPPGAHQVVWVGDADEGGLLSGGWFEVVLSCRDAGADTVAFTAARGMLMVAFDQDARAHGRTGPEGRLTITDRRVVPAFWELPPHDFTNEDGEVVGTYTLTTDTWIWADGVLTSNDAVDGPQEVTVRPTSALRASTSTSAAAAAARRVVEAADDGYALGRPFPIPYN